MRRFRGDAYEVLPQLPRIYDLVVTSPPAYPSPDQAAGRLGTEETEYEYAKNLGLFTRLVRRVLRPRGVFCLIQQPSREHRVMELLAPLLATQWWRMLNTYHWSHGDGSASWVSFLTQSERVRLNHNHPAYGAQEWALPWDTVDPTYGFYEFPRTLVEAVTGLALPHGGNVLDPFCGKAAALQALNPVYDVTGIDIVEAAGDQPAFTRVREPPSGSADEA